jgi:asparagine synthetase B (glutamine-hydrolysing)
MKAPPVSTHGVADFVWRDQRPWNEPSAPLRLEDTVRLWGQFALHRGDGAGGHVLARDRLGVNKLFFTVTPEGEVLSSSFLFDLLQRGHPVERVWSVPSGHAVAVSPARGGYRLHRHAALDFAAEAAEAAEPDAVVRRIRETLAATFERLAAVVRGRRVFVSLSGGLDSTVVALLAREHLCAGELTALTFALRGDSRADAGGDLGFARVAARAAGVRLEVVRPSPDELVELLDTVLLYGQDWRDFNVHCGLVNAALGRWLREQLGDDRGLPPPVLLTGDTMNELMADYSPVVHRGVEHYGLPRLPVGRLRRFLVAGLDSGDREVGVLSAFGLDVLQPYALAAEAYAAVPGAQLERPLAKQELVDRVMGSRVPPAILARPKVRAQVGGASAEGGVLAAIVDRGLDGGFLRRRFAALYGLEERQLARLIRGGLYRFTSEAPWEARSP